MRIFITGANGQLGHELRRALAKHELILGLYPQFDLLNPEVGRLICDARPDVVLHAAAYTNVDGAEGEPEKAMAVNATGTEYVARAAAEVGARLTVLSTDYVFDGHQRTPYFEADQPNPINVYGKSKLEGERRALSCCPNTLVVRTSWLYGIQGTNFVKTIMRKAVERAELRVVDDQRGCPTSAEDLAQVIQRLLDLELKGVVHAAGSGDCTWHEFALAIVSEMNLDTAVRPMTTPEARRPAPRPSYSVLGNQVLAQMGMTLPHWKDALDRFVHNLNCREEEVRK